MAEQGSEKRGDKTAKGLEISPRKRSAVLRDFEKVAGPLRGRNQDRKPKA